MSSAKLLVGGKIHQGWKQIDITRDMRAISGSFSLSVSDRYPGNPGEWRVKPGDACSIFLDEKQVIAGFIEGRASSFSEKSHEVTITGRDKTGDLVDCAPNIGTYELTGLTALQIAKRVAEPFGVPVFSRIKELTVLDKFDIQPGETAYDCLDRACGLSGLMAMGRPDGRIELTREGSDRASIQLIEGKNVIAASYSVDEESRYQTYIVGGQHFGTDNFSGESAAGVEGKATDKNIKRNRTKYIRAAANMTDAQAKELAAWEATNAAANSKKATITVQGWAQAPGLELWRENLVASVKIPTLGINSDMLITGVRYSLGLGGELTVLSLSLPGSYSPKPEIPSDEDIGIDW